MGRPYRNKIECIHKNEEGPKTENRIGAMQDHKKNTSQERNTKMHSEE
jgi:hypothetical protein